MAITFFGVGTNPADSSGLTGPTFAITPPGSMQDGDLVLVSVRYRASTATITNSVTGGQSWTAQDQYNATNIRARLFWCRFNGTWDANPEFTVTTGTNAIDGQMLVFRPTSVAYTWSLDAAPATNTYSAPTTPFTVTVTGRDTVADSTVTLAAWHSVDNNTWGSLSGTGWSKTSLGAQYRNTNNSSTYAYNIRTSQGTVANVSQNQATLGGDAGSVLLVTFAEILAAAALVGASSSAAAGSLEISNPWTGITGVESVGSAGDLAVVAGADDNSASPSGVFATAAPGAVTVNPSAVADGVSSSATAGSLALAASVAGIAGVAATGGAGDAAVGDQPAAPEAPGVQATASVGDLALSWTGIVPAAGVGIGAAVGVLLPHITAVPVGVASTVSAGTATAVNATDSTGLPSGVVSAVAAGSLASVLSTAGIAGTSSAAQAGTITVDAGGIIGGTGQAGSVVATAQVGGLAALTLQTLQGVVVTVTAEEISSGVLSAEIDGVQATMSAGTIVPAIAMPIPSVSAVASVGTVARVMTAIVAPSGAQSVATVGNLAAGTAGQATVGIGGVESAAEAGSIVVEWTFDLTLGGVESTTDIGTINVAAGDTEPAEVFPAGAQATVQLGVLSTGEVLVSIPSIAMQAQIGAISIIGAAPQPLDKPDAILVAAELSATISCMPEMSADVRITPIS